MTSSQRREVVRRFLAGESVEWISRCVTPPQRGNETGFRYAYRVLVREHGVEDAIRSALRRAAKPRRRRRK